MLAKKRKFEKNIKSPKQMERHLKGISNHRRIEILFLIANNKGINVDDIAKRLNCNMKTISGHVLRLDQAGLIRKSYRGRAVNQELSPYGKILYDFLLSFSRR